MPPEPLPPWDRKEFFRERKHERSDNLGPSLARWRDSSHREFNRWGSSSEFRTRPIPGHGKQGGWHLFPEESHHGYGSSRSGERVVEDENFRPFPRGEGRYGRNNRDHRGSYNNQREWRSHSWETNNGFSNGPVRAHDVVNDEQKSREEATASYSSHSNGGFGSTWDQIRPREQHDRTSGPNGFGTVQKCEGEDATGLNDWKPIKWTRTGSLSSRVSGLIRLSSSKSIGALESSEAKVESEMKSASPVQSPSGDANACVTSAAASEETTTSRKKPRLGWGEGLAKYEKKKVDGPEVTSSKDGAGSASGNTETSHPIGSSLVDKSPRMMSFSDCASPTTPSSVACSSSPGLEEKSFGKAATIDNDIYNLCGSPDPVSQEHSDEGLSFNLENLDPNTMAKMSALLSELLRQDDPGPDSSYIRATAMNKVLILKGSISKNLEVTESEIDQLETELKSLNSTLGASSPSASSSLRLVDNAKSCSERGEAKSLIPRPAPLQIASAGEADEEKLHSSNGDKEENFAVHKDVDVDSPGTVTSKFVEPLSLVKAVSSDAVTHATEDSRDVLFTGKKVRDSMHGSAFRDHRSLPEGEITAVKSNAVVLCFGSDVQHGAIASSNKELIAEAHEVFNRIFPRREHTLNIVSVGNASSSQSYLSVKEKLAIRKRFVKFKERVITLKFKAFQHLWKEDMRLQSIRKHRAKSQKKFELLQNGYQKHRSSIRSRFSSPAGSVSLVPTAEVINYTGKLLMDSRVKLFRDTLKMPSLILDKNEKVASKFISNNGLVEDPCAVEKARAIVNPWTPAEKDVFMDKFAVLGKDFKKIASFLDHKTTADCVEFYYKNHKSDSFEKKKKSDSGGKQEKSFSSCNYLMTSGNKWREKNAASLDILGAASVMAANAIGNTKGRQACSGRMVLGGCGEPRASYADDGTAERSSNFDFTGNDREAAAADVLAGICVSLSSEAMSSCITSSVDPGDSFREWKSQRIGSVIGRPFTPQNADDETCSDESCGEMDSTDWTDEEKSIFVQAVSSFGRDFSKIARCVRTRSRDQCKVFFSKAKKCLGLDRIRPGPGNERTSVGDDVNGSGSGSDGACAIEVGSGVCSDDKSDSKMDEDLPLSSPKLKQEEPDITETMNSQTSLRRLEGKNEGELLEVVHKSSAGGSEPCAFDSCQTWSRPNAVSDGDSNIVNGADDQMLPVNESESVLVKIAAERKTSTELEGEDKEPTVGVKPDDGGHGNQMKEIDEKRYESTSVESASPCVLGESNLEGNTSSHLAAVSSCSGFGLNGGCRRTASLEPISEDKCCTVILTNNTCLAPAHSASVDSGSTQSEKNGTEDKMSSTSDIQESRDGCQAAVSRDEFSDHVAGVLRVYPSQLPILKETNGELRSREHSSDVQSHSNLDRSSDSPFTTQPCFLQKCNNLKPPCPMTEFPLVSLSPKAHSQSLSDSEKSSRSGDVKLFGKILSNSSTVLKENLTQQENNEVKEGNHHVHTPINKSSNLKFSNLCNSDGSSAILKFDSSSYLGLENVQMRSSYAYLDANRLPAFSDILLARYPDAFSNFPTPSSKTDQLQQPIAKAAERSSSGNSNGNGMVDYQVYKSWDNNKKVQPFTVDMKSRQDMFSDLQRRNGIEALASFQRPGRGRISDPVAALKLHFAKTEQFGGGQGSNNVVREDSDSWRGNEDIGR